MIPGLEQFDPATLDDTVDWADLAGLPEESDPEGEA